VEVIPIQMIVRESRYRLRDSNKRDSHSHEVQKCRANQNSASMLFIYS